MAPSVKAPYFNSGRIAVDGRSRIDDFARLSAGDGGITIGFNLRIAACCFLAEMSKIRLDESNLSYQVVYSNSDDHSGAELTNPMVARELTDVQSVFVHICKHAIPRGGRVVLSGIRFGDGAALGAWSLADGKNEMFGAIASGLTRRMRDRQRGLIEKERWYGERLQDKNEQTKR